MSDSSVSSSSSRSPSPEVVKKKGKSSKSKAKPKASASKGKNEGTDPTWDFKPPAGFVPLEDDCDAGEFDWDRVKDDEDVELWLIRIPEGVKPKYMEGLKIDDVPSIKSVKVGSMARKYATFDIWSVGSDPADDSVVGGEEIRHLSCLLPRKKKGKFYPAPKGIARHLVFAAQPVKPAVPIEESMPLKNTTTGKYQNPPREGYPDDVLTHGFAPYGSHTTITANDADMDVDEEDVEPPPPAQPRKTEDSRQKNEPTPKKAKGKKRKGFAEETPGAPVAKKSRKSKSSA